MENSRLRVGTDLRSVSCMVAGDEGYDQAAMEPLRSNKGELLDRTSWRSSASSPSGVARYGISTSNGTEAHCTWHWPASDGPDDEVIVPFLYVLASSSRSARRA